METLAGTTSLEESATVTFEHAMPQAGSAPLDPETFQSLCQRPTIPAPRYTGIARRSARRALVPPGCVLPAVPCGALASNLHLQQAGASSAIPVTLRFAQRPGGEGLGGRKSVYESRRPRIHEGMARRWPRARALRQAPGSERMLYHARSSLHGGHTQGRSCRRRSPATSFVDDFA